MNKFAENLKALREKAGLSTQDVADRVNCTRQAVESWEAGDAEPNMNETLELAKLFGVTVEYLITGEDNAKEVVVEKEVVKEVVKEVPPDDYDLFKTTVLQRLKIAIVSVSILWVIFLIFFIILLAVIPFKEGWYLHLIMLAFIVAIPLGITRSIRTYINPNFLKRKKKNKDKDDKTK